MARAASGFKTRLEPQDEFPHDPGEAKNYNESLYFNVFDPAKKTGGWFRIGNRPNEDYAEISVCLDLRDGRVAFTFGRPAIEGNKVPASMRSSCLGGHPPDKPGDDALDFWRPAS